jgi:branched-chain amino acid transport system substrate-binding protein
MRRTWITALTGAVLFTMTACGGSAPNATDGGKTCGTITIGTLHPGSGPYAADGQQMDNGAQLAVEAINKAGGISSLDGTELALSTGDTQSKPEIGQSEAQRLIQNSAVALVGTYQSAVSMNVAAVAERGQVPFVMDITADDAVLDQGYEYSFRLQPPNSSMGVRGARYLEKIAEAPETSGDKDPKKLRDAIAGVSLDPLVVSGGPVKFDDKGENVNALPVVMQVQDGKVAVVYPKDRADAKPHYPA